MTITPNMTMLQILIDMLARSRLAPRRRAAA
jgi:hypothetical protein